MNKPKPLKPNDTIGLIAPSGRIGNISDIDRATDYIKGLGLNVKEGGAIRKGYGYLAGSDSERLEDIHTMFSDDSVDGIFCLRGGYGATRLANMVNTKIIKKSPKIFVGYSDITALHLLFNQAAGLVTFHGPMPVADMISDTFEVFSKKSFLEAISGTKPLGELKNPAGYKLNSLVPGKATAPLTGGNLTLITHSIGTPYEIDTKGKILFIEDINMEPYQVDRCLSQLLNSGKLQDAAGFLIGDWNNTQPYRTNPSLSVDQVISDLIIPLGKPVISNFRAGHCEPKITFPLGVSITLDADNEKVLVLESCCEE